MNRIKASEEPPLRIGAVTYLNAKPLFYRLSRACLSADIPIELVIDLPSRLANRLAEGKLDVALIPSIEYFRHSDYSIVSNACVACDGPVRSVKLYSRVPVEQIRSLALDEGSRTSAAMVQILLAEHYGQTPRVEQLPIGSSLSDSKADAMMLIGDRAMHVSDGHFEFIWDLGEEWSRWQKLPFVFAMWIAPHHGRQASFDREALSQLLATTRDQGVAHLEEIAHEEAPTLNLPEQECLEYLRDHLHFHLGERQRNGLKTFYQLAVKHNLATPGVDLVFSN